MSDDALRAELRTLDDLAYFRRRKEIAAREGILVGQLDRVRESERKAARNAKTSASDDAWPSPVDGEQLAAGIEAALRRFVVLDAHAYELVTLWVIGTHAYARRNVWPLLLIRSPQRECGKSTLLDVLERLVGHPMAAGNASLATLFRSAASGPTQLLDELDAWVALDPQVVGYLRAGWQSGRPFLRCDPETLEVHEYPCYGPRALAINGDLTDDALRSRCLAVEMRRALPGERGERFRAARAYPELADLRAMAARWVQDHADAIGTYTVADEELPGLGDRATDNAEALLAIAVAIGGEWPDRCRAAVLGAPREEPTDLSAMLLADLAELLDALPADAEAVATSHMLEHLLALTDRPWPTCRRGGQPIVGDWLRRRLSPYGLRPERHYIAGTRQRGYSVAPLREAIARYLTPPLTPSGDVSEVSQVSQPEPRDTPRAQESPGTGHVGRLGRVNGASQGGGMRIAPFAPGPLRDEFEQYVGTLESDGMERDEAELVAAEFMGLLMPAREVAK